MNESEELSESRSQNVRSQTPLTGCAVKCFGMWLFERCSMLNAGNGAFAGEVSCKT